MPVKKAESPLLVPERQTQEEYQDQGHVDPAIDSQYSTWQQRQIHRPEAP